MKNTMVIAQRELTERRFVIISATAFALLALLVPFMPGVQSGERRGALVVTSFILAVNFTAGLAAILGASILGRELSDGRLSFYFSKPMSSNAIWFGKLIAAALLILVCFAIIALPGLLAGMKSIDEETEIMPRCGWSSNSRSPPSRHNYHLGISRTRAPRAQTRAR